MIKYLPQRSNYAFIKHEKGRSVEDAIRLFPSVVMPKIIDIDTSEAQIYTDELGDKNQVEKMSAFIQSEIDGRQKTISLYLKLNPEYTVELFDVGNLDKEYYLLYNINKAQNDTGHMETMIVTKDEVEIFDPNGKTSGYNFSDWAQELTNIINLRDGTSRKLIRSYDTLACPQVLSNKTIVMNQKEYGDCTIWSYYYLWLRIKNPEVQRDEIIYYMQHLPPLIMKSKSKLISGLINTKIPNITVKLNNKTITYDLSRKYFWIGFFQMCIHFGMDENLFPPAIRDMMEEIGDTLIIPEYNVLTYIPIIITFDNYNNYIKDFAKGCITGLRLYKPEIDNVTVNVIKSTKEIIKMKYTIRKK